MRKHLRPTSFFAALTVVVVFTSVQVAHARLMQTEAEVAREYGAPVGKAQSEYGPLVTYNYKDFLVIVSFAGGRSQNEFYVHRFGGSQLTNREIFNFLEMNQNISGGAWNWNWPVPVWVRVDGSALAAIYKKVPTVGRPGLQVCTLAFARQHKIAGILTAEEATKNEFGIPGTHK